MFVWRDMVPGMLPSQKWRKSKNRPSHAKIPKILKILGDQPLAPPTTYYPATKHICTDRACFYVHFGVLGAALQ